MGRKTLISKRSGVRWLACLVVLAGTLLAASLANAAPVIYPTGVDNSFAPLAGGSVDPHYTLDGGNAIVLSEGNYWFQWVKPSDARWLYNANVLDSGLRGTHVFETTFDLTGYDPSTAQLSFNCALDQFGTISLNSTVEASLPDQNWLGKLNPITINKDFVSGINTLEFSIAFPDGGDGLVVSGINLSATPTTPVPLPPTLLLMGSGLLGLLGLRRKFKG